MEETIDFFAGLGTVHKLVWLVICLSFFLIVESLTPLFKGGYRAKSHLKTNLALITGVLICNLILSVISVALFEWLDTNDWGILNFVDGALWMELLASLVVLDFIAQYCAHWSVHNIKPLWRTHLVHHSDTHVDTTTGLRLHPLDYLVREGFAIFAIFLLDIPLAFYLMYRIFTIAFTHFNHANIMLPIKVDKAISYVFVSPNMHKFHHHYRVPWTDKNYGNILSIWDRLFGTFYYGDVGQIKYGLDITDEDKANDLKYQLMLPLTNNGLALRAKGNQENK